MKTRRNIAIALVLAVIACAFVLELRSFAQPGPYDINLPNWQKLKAPYDDDADGWEKNILSKHSKKYCVIHKKKKDGTTTVHPPGCARATSQSDDFKSEIIPVANTPVPLPTAVPKPTGSNVTQQIPCANQADRDAIVATFDPTP